MSFAGTPLGQGRRLDHHTFLNKPNSNSSSNTRNQPTSPQRPVQASYVHGAPSLGTRSPPKPPSAAAAAAATTQEDEPALVRFARLKQRDPNISTSISARIGTVPSPPKPEKWSVKDTTVNVANAFTLAAEEIMSSASATNNNNNPNNSWASGSRTTATNPHVPRSTSVEYEKETQSTVTRRLGAPPNRLAHAPPSRSNGTGLNKKPVAKQVSIHHVPDSEGEEDSQQHRRNERGKSPLEHVVDMTKRALAPATFYLRQRSQEPSADTSQTNGNGNGHNSSYDYSAEEREFQSAKSSASATRSTASAHHKKGRMSLDNKAYRPSASDLDESDEGDDDDGRKVRKRKSKKKEPHGGPLTTLPVAGYEKKKRRKSRGSKGNAVDMDEDDSTGLSDEHQSEQRSTQRVSAPNSRTSQSRGSITHQYPPDDSGQPDTSIDIEQGLDSIPEMNESPLLNDTPSSRSAKPKSKSKAAAHPSASSISFSIGGLLGKLVNLTGRAVASLFLWFFSLISALSMLVGRVCGTAFDVVFSRPLRWLSNANPGLGTQFGKYAVLALTVYAAWWLLQDRTLSFSLGQWIPLRSSTPYHAPDIPAANIAELSARLQTIENALSGLSIDQKGFRTRQETEAKTHAEVVGRLGSLESRIQRENQRALEAEQLYRVSASQGLQAVRHEVEVLHAQLEAQGESGRGGGGETDEEARAKLKALEERVGSVEGGVKEALEMGKHSVKAGGGSSAAWWNKLSTGRSGLTIKSTDGQDVTTLISHLVDSAVSLRGKDDLARPDFALHSAGAQVIGSLTSPTFEMRPQSIGGQLFGMITGNGYAIGRPPVTALHHELHNGHCWPFAGTEGQLAVALAAPTYISDISIDHVAKEVATDMRSAPREMEVWGMVEGKDNIVKVRAWQAEKAARRKEAEATGVSVAERDLEVPYPKTLSKFPQYLRIASFTYDIHSPKHIQTFPVDEDIRALGVDFGIVALRIKSNWGRDEYTCLYRLRVHGQRMGETPLPYPEESV